MTIEEIQAAIRGSIPPGLDVRAGKTVFDDGHYEYNAAVFETEVDGSGHYRMLGHCWFAADPGSLITSIVAQVQEGLCRCCSCEDKRAQAQERVS